jgi:hypothetical protein
MTIHQEVVDAVLGSRPDLCPLMENFSKNFDVTWARDIRLYGMDVIAFFIRPKRFVSEMCKRGKTRGGMILRFPGGRESDSFWECRGPGILTVCRTPS